MRTIGEPPVISSQDSDPALVTEVRSGGRAAFGALFDRHARAIYNFCFRKTAEWQRAEDLTSIVFLEAWRGRDRIRLSDDSALPWLYGIAHNVCRNEARSRRRHRAALARLRPDADEPDVADDVASRLDDERSMAAVHAAIRRLPRRERDVLHLVVWSELDYQSAADALGVPVGTVKSRVSRAKRRLAADPQLLEGLGPS